MQPNNVTPRYQVMLPNIPNKMKNRVVFQTRQLLQGLPLESPKLDACYQTRP
jgi:hypothetical protein